MTNAQLTASRLELAYKCPGSQAHEHVQTTSDAAERGTRIHEYIAAIMEGAESVLPSDHESAAVCTLLDRQELLETASPNPYSSLYTEQAFYLCPASGEVGMIEAEHHRDYSGAPRGSIPGTADVAAVEEDRVRITDWKTGVGEIPHPADNHQLRFLGLAAARCFGKDEAVVQIGRIGADGSVELHADTLQSGELTATEVELARIAYRVEQARTGKPEYQVGNHCRYCPALPHCPAIAGAAQAILEGPPEELTPKRAAEMWNRLQAVEAAAKKTRQALSQYVYERPIPTAENRQLKVVETRRENIDSRKAYLILSQNLPEESIAASVSITKSSLSAGLDKEAQNSAITAFRDAGAISETYSESLREVKGG